MSTAPRAYAYLRLSRDEAERPGLLTEKFERQRATALELAERHGLHLPPDHILIEQESGSRLRNRPVLLRLLELCHAGQCSHIITPFQDRLDRLEDKREQADLEDALYAGAVTIVSRDGVTRYDDDLDPLPAEVRALIARHELRLYSRRRREANRQRLRANARYSGYAPWGYRRDPDAPGGYAIVPEEYAEVERVLARLLAGDPLRAILRDLQARSVPTPGHGRRASPGATWDYGTLYGIVHNPIYAGYHARRTQRVRGHGYRAAAPEQFELPEGEPGGWPHPITLAQWYAICARTAPWRDRGRAGTALLTGLLVCPAGSRMRAAGAGRSYGCTCEGDGPRHYTNRPRWDAFAERLFCGFVAALPAAVLDVPVPQAEHQPDRAALAAQLERAARAMRQHESDARAMVADGERQRRLLGDDLYESVLGRTRQEWEASRREVDALRARLAEPDRAEALSLLSAVRAHGAEGFWAAATGHERRELLRAIVAQIALQDVGGRMRHYREASVVWQGWVSRAGLAIEVPPAWYGTRQRR